ncbi:RiPP maturation radical SAM C-methyltransferase [Cryptosporangium sp. NPDC051539]|uniref:RiPP maturation radical SAM C-methyltransferase n=1 Tax=Cryptosporangium sp. NPDC051539 TaxID=3363962 RepID=UPI0037A88E47
MRIALTAMPWHGLETQSLPLGILKACATRCHRPHQVVEYYANLAWADLLDEKSDSIITTDDYDYIANVGVWHSIGEWVFAGALYDDPEWRREEFLRYVSERHVDPGKALEMRPVADEFVDLAVDHLLELDPDLVGFTTTFSQNAASLAVARRVKQRRPSLPVVIGGGNCDGPMGRAMATSFPFVDYVVSGEGERAFVALVDALADGGDLTGVPGLIWRQEDSQRVNPPVAPMPMGQVPRPDYTGWQQAFDDSRAAATVRPRLTLEAARGCWWGEKHHCTFCGLNGTSMTFRAKPAAQFLEDLTSMVATHQILDVVMVDNIMSNDYFHELLPELEKLGWDVTIRYEVKANLRAEQLGALSAAGVRHIQPGIESLCSTALRLMDKGVRASQNVQVLRDSDDYGLTVDWNILYGFPGETDEDYAVLLGQLPALIHLQPPAGITRILLERFSPYFERPELGFALRRPASQYQHVYAMPTESLYDLAYQFEGEIKGLTGDLEKDLHRAVRTWQEAGPASVLTQTETHDGVLVDDRRFGWPERTYTLTDPLAVRVLTALRVPRSLRAVLTEAADGDAERARPALDALVDRGLVFLDGDRAVALPTLTVPFRPGVSS